MVRMPASFCSHSSLPICSRLPGPARGLIERYPHLWMPSLSSWEDAGDPHPTPGAFCYTFLPLSTLLSPVCLSTSLIYSSQLLLLVTECKKERLLKFMEFLFCAWYSLGSVSSISLPNHSHRVGMMKKLRL